MLPVASVADAKSAAFSMKGDRHASSTIFVRGRSLAIDSQALVKLWTRRLGQSCFVAMWAQVGA
jgi:hypothetical protein